MYYFSKMRLLKVTMNFSGKGGNQGDIFNWNKTNSDWEKTWSWRTVSYQMENLGFKFLNWSCGFRQQPSFCFTKRIWVSLEGQKAQRLKLKGQNQEKTVFPNKKRISAPVQCSCLHQNHLWRALCTCYSEKTIPTKISTYYYYVTWKLKHMKVSSRLQKTQSVREENKTTHRKIKKQISPGQCG